MKYGMLAAALVLAPMAHAQDCSLIEGLITSGEKDEFEGILDDEIDDGLFEATVTFSRADVCAVDTFEPMYYCKWDAATQADADKAIMPLYDMAKVCLSAGWAWDDIAGHKSDPGTTILEGYRIRKSSGAHAGAVVRLYMTAVDNAPQRETWLELFYE